jgi:hypothetical protein
LSPVERQLFPVHGEEILAEELPQVLEQIAEAADDRIVSAYRLAGLSYVDYVCDYCPEYAHPDHKDENGSHYLQGSKKEVS